MTSYTVTITDTTDGVSGWGLQVLCVTGATESGGASATAGNNTSGTPDIPVTPGGSGSFLVFAVENATGGSPPAFTPAASCTFDMNFQDTTSGTVYGAGHYTGTVTSGTPVTVGATNACIYEIAAYELPASGTPALDASTPAFTHNTGTTLASAAFTPPTSGCVLVALVANNFGGLGSLTGLAVSSSPSLTWTKRAVPAGTSLDGDVAVYTATVAPVSPVISTTSLPPAQVGVAYSATLAATGGTAPYTWSIVSGSLPLWASLNSSTGAITGTPSSLGTAVFTVQVSDNASLTATQSLTLDMIVNGQLGTPAIPGRAQPGNVIPGQVALAPAPVPSAAPAPFTARTSRTWQQRFRPYRRWLQVPLAQPSAYADADTGHGADAGELVTVVPASDTGHGTDAGEAVAATLPGSDASGAAADAGESITATLSDGDASGAAADGGEGVGVQPGITSVARVSRTWQERFRPKRKFQVPLAQPSAYVSSETGTGTDAGEAVTAAVTDADTGHGADAGEAVALSDADTGHGADAGELVAVALSGSDTGHGADAGELVTAALSDADTGHGADAGEAVTASLSDAESGSALDAGEAVARQDFILGAALVSRVWVERFKPYRKFQVPVFFPAPVPAVADSDASGTAADAGELVTAAVPGTDAGHGTDAGELIAAALPSQDASGSDDEGTTVRLGSAESGSALDAGEQVAAALSGSDTGHGTDAGELVTAAVPGADTGHGTDAGEGVTASATGSDTGTGTDAGEALAAADFMRGTAMVSPAWLTRWGGQRFPRQTQGVFFPTGLTVVTDADTGLGFDAEISNPFPVDTPETGAGADGGESLAVTVKSAALTSDTSQATDSEVQPGASDSDTGHGADDGQVASGTFTSSDTGHGADAESAKFGPDASVSDGDAAAASDQEVIDVYAYQPLTRFRGGGFRAPLPRFPVPAPAPEGRVSVVAVLQEALRVSIEITADR